MLESRLIKFFKLRLLINPQRFNIEREQDKSKMTHFIKSFLRILRELSININYFRKMWDTRPILEMHAPYLRWSREKESKGRGQLREVNFNVGTRKRTLWTSIAVTSSAWPPHSGCALSSLK